MIADLRDRFCAQRRRLLHPVDFHRAWFRELALFYRHLSREEFWMRYHETRKQSAELADLDAKPDAGPPLVWTHTDYCILRQMYYHRDRCFHEAALYLDNGGEWLEYGCGVGPASAWLEDHRPDAIGVAVDIPSRTLDFATWRFERRHRMRGYELPRVRVQVLPEIPEPLERRGFHLIICSEVLEHVPDPLKTCVDLVRVLAGGGYLLVNFVEVEPGGANLAEAQRARAETLRYLFEELGPIRPITAHGPDGIYQKC